MANTGKRYASGRQRRLISWQVFPGLKRSADRFFVDIVKVEASGNWCKPRLMALMDRQIGYDCHK